MTEDLLMAGLAIVVFVKMKSIVVLQKLKEKLSQTAFEGFKSLIKIIDGD